MTELTDGERFSLSRAVMNILNHWQVKAVDQITLLGLPQNTRLRSLKRYYENTPLPNTPEVMERVEHILGIAEALRTTYPHNYDITALWMNTPHRRFHNRSPLTTILEEGLPGLVAVRSHVDCAFSWYLTEPEH